MTYKGRIGDIIEIPISRGLAYAQYTHKYGDYGGVIRILDGIFQNRPLDFEILINKQHKFVVLFPFTSAVNQHLYEVVGHEPVPQEFSQFPLFRSGFVDKNGNVKIWWLWDGKTEWRVGNLTPDQMKLPIREIPDVKALRMMIELAFLVSTNRPESSSEVLATTTITKRFKPISNEQEVIIHLDGINLAQEIYDTYDLSTLEDKIIECLEKFKVGEFEGNEFGDKETKLYLTGTDAENLFETIEPILREYPLAQNAIVDLRYGAPGAPERHIRIS
jgi:hypothetical protein